MSSRRSQGAFWNRVSRRLLVSSQYLFWLLPVLGHGGCVQEVVEHKTWARGYRLSQGQGVDPVNNENLHISVKILIHLSQGASQMWFSLEYETSGIRRFE